MSVVHEPSRGPLPDWALDLTVPLADIQYKPGWMIRVGMPGPFMQWIFKDEKGELQYCRKWLLYETMNASEVVRTAWAAVLMAEEHEARELFRYRGRMIFGPHQSVDALADFARSKDNLALAPDPV